MQYLLKIFVLYFGCSYNKRKKGPNFWCDILDNCKKRIENFWNEKILKRAKVE